MHELIPVFKKDVINMKVAEVARRISADYKDSELVLVGVLKGAFVFMSDLMRCLTIPVEVDFVCASSYGSDTSSSGKIKLTKELDIDIKNKHILVVEDIVDTGITLSYLSNYLKSFSPKSIKICAMLDKRERREVEIKTDYSCYVIESGFLVGYGLDYAEKYRNLPEIYQLKL
ncbi:MAG: hypoxanthine phosphoribosyltransferase [Desulfobacterium sp.]|nr:hypoxanthine phosphoribosyltransferase [Desulfobacterium sp.]MBU3949916.1 hypoxanthine phosphoribosyltransferase [Pseudomonadota bacterium]MBU4037982.1 hypoxanthine phosphoribosyltransferase [Pseudomonadota bacterium]